ncbi:hypothetical protein SASPL_119081 [Salvia splendens]|uniref:Uncharacterized protein n=1 Tax=Salvia splendens TaxID=180675 RepID=A0A8X8Y2Z1_SALSN|nr:hypothetical protein SASPL_119081 [Salvia splendens]
MTRCFHMISNQPCYEGRDADADLVKTGDNADYSLIYEKRKETEEMVMLVTYVVARSDLFGHMYMIVGLTGRDCVNNIRMDCNSFGYLRGAQRSAARSIMEANNGQPS